MRGTMLFSAAVAALAIGALPASAQTTTPQTPSQVTVPSGQHSGAGISGQPGNKGGPAAQAPSSGTSTPGTSANEQQNPSVRQQDTAKIPGQPGNKSGPAAKQPSTPTSK